MVKYCEKLLVLVFIFLSVTSGIYAEHIEFDSKAERAIEMYLESLPISQQISEIFLVNIEGNSSYRAVEDTKDLFGDKTSEPLVPGGCLLFSYNIASDPLEMIRFNKSIADYCDRYGVERPYIATDQEGGLVNRLRSITSYLPSAQRVSEKMSPKEAYYMYYFQGLQMKYLGFDMNLAPVAEGSEEWNKVFLSSRSFGKTNISSVYSYVCAKAYEDSGIGSVIKHFPGNTNADPHTGLPEINQPLSIIYNYYIMPFAFVLQSYPSGVLMSHARITSIDEKVPACLSSVWVTEILRKKLGYTGLVLSDDIFMGALADNGFPPEKACVEAIKAGVDVIMLSEKKFASVALVLLSEAEKDVVFRQRLFEAEKNVIKYKIQCGILDLQEENGNVKIIRNDFEKQSGDVEQRLESYKLNYVKGVKLYNSCF